MILLFMNWWKRTKSSGIQKLVGDTKMMTASFYFARFFTDQTIIAKPLNCNLSEAKKK